MPCSRRSRAGRIRIPRLYISIRSKTPPTEKKIYRDRSSRTSHEYAVLIDLVRFTRPDSQAQEESTCVYIEIPGGNVPGNIHAPAPNHLLAVHARCDSSIKSAFLARPGGRATPASLHSSAIFHAVLAFVTGSRDERRREYIAANIRLYELFFIPRNGARVDRLNFHFKQNVSLRGFVDYY